MDQFRIAHFQILSELGTGGMGKVYKAFDESLNREVAVKILRPELSQDPKVVHNFLHEARAAAAINHPHVVQIYFCGQEDNQPYIVMELVQGRTLDEILEEKGRLPESVAITIALEAAKGLQAGYRLGFVHSDIKPANLFIDERHGVKILDFGLAKLANQETDGQEGIWGTPYYLPPERVKGEPEDYRSDIYSLGATLFHVIAGKPPFEDDDVTQLVLKRIHERPPELIDLVPGLHTKTSDVVAKMLHPNILMRYRDYDHIINDLYAAQAEIVSTVAPSAPSTISASPVPTEIPSSPSGASQSALPLAPKPPLKAMIPLVVGALLLIACVAFFVFSKPKKSYKEEFIPGAKLSISFQPRFTRVPNNIPDVISNLPDYGDPYADRGQGFSYGWNSKNKNAKARSEKNVSDMRYSRFNYMQSGGDFYWEIGLPKGDYEVKIVAGDPEKVEGDFKILVEDQLVVDEAPRSYVPWVIKEKKIAVSDGKLTIRNAPGARNNKICFVEIKPVVETVAPVPKVPVVATNRMFSRPQGTLSSKQQGTEPSRTPTDLSRIKPQLDKAYSHLDTELIRTQLQALTNSLGANIPAEIKAELFKLELLQKLKLRIKSLVGSPLVKNVSINNASGDLVEVNDNELSFKNRDGAQFSLLWRDLESTFLTSLASNTLNQAKDSKTTFAETYLALAIIFHKKGSMELASQYARAAIQYDPSMETFVNENGLPLTYTPPKPVPTQPPKPK